MRHLMRDFPEPDEPSWTGVFIAYFVLMVIAVLAVFE